ncbi:MAG: hypothetical protein UV58_C0002G0016 [Candidatus Wolfebacteria bacterium GW2011_GWC1_43_10]|uniref:Uncharacterized protein n=2 Tax=Candidatus Wolfeibacteriota TaxID=1752735 RepID=A0A0G1EJ01_9BACT|nr:MAG: hypothetical protein UV58_C0002G0016 [Candidatus Wolfebacteria bacterium GW2011_GWC1_43_10]KKT23063.1 MAG: hypothetical protein UW08_C0001G0026 [Parcubacteria group bacterium GW2011_GWB1_43_8b]OGM89148.1 MAG: hypothetical protein A2108_02230 [Candidatus Wolfebacteria bacterium GWA1_42_9]
MEPKTIIKNLRALRVIQPDENFSARSRLVVLSCSPEIPGNFPTERGWYLVAVRHLQRIGLSLSFTVGVAVLILSIFYATRELSPLFLPGLNEKRVVAEAEMINSQIDIQLSQLEHFQETSQKGNQALQQAANTQLNHLNETVIEKEAENNTPNFSSSVLETNSKINQILESLSE